MAEEETSGILDCYETRRFWIGWSGNKIQLASGSDTGRHFLDWFDEQPRPVYALSLSTGPDASGDWKYSSKEGC